MSRFASQGRAQPPWALNMEWREAVHEPMVALADTLAASFATSTVTPCRADAAVRVLRGIEFIRQALAPSPRRPHLSSKRVPEVHDAGNGHKQSSSITVSCVVRVQHRRPCQRGQRGKHGQLCCSTSHAAHPGPLWRILCRTCPQARLGVLHFRVSPCQAPCTAVVSRGLLHALKRPCFLLGSSDSDTLLTQALVVQFQALSGHQKLPRRTGSLIHDLRPPP